MMPKYAGGRKGGRTDSEKEGGNGLKLVTNLDLIFCFVDLIKILGGATLCQPKLLHVGRTRAEGERGTGKRVDHPEEKLLKGKRTEKRNRKAEPEEGSANMRKSL